MRRATTASYVIELEVGYGWNRLNRQMARENAGGRRKKLYTPGTRELLDKKCRVACSIYNDALGEALKRLHKLQHDREYQAALRDYADARQKKESLDGFVGRFWALKQKHGYTEYALYAYIKSARNHFNSALGSAESQRLASRAYRAVENVRRGKARSVQYRSRQKGFTIEASSAQSTLKYVGYACIQFGRGHLYPLIVKPNDAYVETALSRDRVKLVMLTQKRIRGRDRYYAQLVMEGAPPRTKGLAYGPEDARVGIDLGVSTAAIVTDDGAALVELAPDTSVDDGQLRRLNRAIERCARAAKEDRKRSASDIKKERPRSSSRRCERLRTERRELLRKAAAKRRASNNHLANVIVGMGQDVRIGRIDMAKFARRTETVRRHKTDGRYFSRKRFGKTIQSRAPASVVTAVKRKLEYVGKSVRMIDPSIIKPSQYDPVVDTYIKKPLDQRSMLIGGQVVQRDLFSAFLIKNTTDGLEAVDRQRCIQELEQFLVHQSAAIRAAKNQHSKTLDWYIRDFAV